MDKTSVSVNASKMGGVPMAQERQQSQCQHHPGQATDMRGIVNIKTLSMKDTFFFSHDFGARNDPKLQNVLMEHGCEGLGVFWCVVEQIYEQGGSLPLANCKSIAFALHVDCKVVESIVNNFGLFENDGETFWSASINNRLNKRAEIAQKRKNAAMNRWNKPQNYANAPNENANAQSCDANAMHCNAIKGKERKEKERKVNNIDRESKKAETAKRFTPPSIEEVQSYISEKEYSVDAESFVAFYSSKNWFIGKNKMKDWHAAIVTWEKRNNDFPAKKQTTTKNVNDIWGK
jgi:hypothetical protein